MTQPTSSSTVQRVETAMDHTFTMQGVAVLLTIVVAIVTITGTIWRMWNKIEENGEARAKAITDAVNADKKTSDDRLKDLERKVVDFMPRAEIEEAILHEKNNRQTGETRLREQAEKHERDIRDIMVSVGRIDTKVDNQSSDIREIKDLVKELSRDLKRAGDHG